MITGRLLQRDELPLVWTIDRREVIHNTYRLVDGALALRPDYFAAITDAYIVYPWEIDRDPKGSLLHDL